MAKDSRNAESADNAAVKKRRVTKQSTNSETPVARAAASTDLYTQVIDREAKIAKEGNADEDRTLYFKLCQEIRDLLTEVDALKKKNKKDSNKEAIKEKKTQICIKILGLKKLNRLEKVRVQENRNALQKAREQVDSDHLQLQNLLYEVSHLTKEVKKCLELKSKDEGVVLVSVEEFYASAPASLSNPEVTKNDEHKLRLARLQWELAQRKELSSQCRKLEASKEVVGKEIEAKKEQLNNLGPNLKTILDASKPLQDSLGIPIDKAKKIQEKALMLPKPLYVAFVQAEGYSHCVKWLSVSLSGECDKALTEELHLDDISSDDSDSDNEGEQSHRRKVNYQDRRKASASNPSDRVEQMKKECMKKHPLSVVLKITLPSEEALSLELQWLGFLEVVCALPAVSTGGQDGGSAIAAEDVLSAKNLLSHLFPGDTGEELPNASSLYQLRKVGLDVFTPGTSTGLPYKWAQELCGLDVVSSSVEPVVSICQANLEKVVKAVRQRFDARLTLARELQQLEKGFTVPLKKISSTLTSLVIVTSQDVQKSLSGNILMEADMLDPSYLYYKASILSGVYRVYAFVCLSPDYPRVAPMFVVDSMFKGTARVENRGGLKDIEREINVYLDKPSTKYGVLTQQIQKLLLCIEVFVVTEFGGENAGTSLFFRKHMGRTRSHPYRFVNSAGGIFTHR